MKLELSPESSAAHKKKKREKKKKRKHKHKHNKDSKESKEGKEKDRSKKDPNIARLLKEENEPASFSSADSSRSSMSPTFDITI